MESMTMYVGDRPWVREDLVRLPDDGNRYEIVDGDLVVTPSPSSAHQFAGLGLYRQLFATCPAHLRVGSAPLDVILDERTVLQPDLFVVQRDHIEPRGVGGRPELAVEVLSPTTERLDRTVKLARYERSGTPSYWLADPVEPSLTAFELRGQGDQRRYEQVAHVIGDQSWTAQVPYEATITPARWLD